MRTIFNKIKPYRWVGIWMLVFLFSCKKANEAVDAEYLNPDLVTSATIEGLFTQGLQQLGTFRLAYNENWHLIEDYLTDMLGTTGFINSGVNREFKNDINPYGNSFDRLRPFLYVQKQFDELPEDQKGDYQIFLWTSHAVRDYIFYRLADIYDDVPYSEAQQSIQKLYFPKFDKQSDIYQGVLADLKQIASNLQGYTLSSSYVHSLFPKNDILNGGDISKWRRFVNSLRLRLGLRLATANPSLAQSTIQEVLADGFYAKDLASSITMTEIPANVSLTNSTLIFQTMVEWRGGGGGKLFLPQKMLEVLRKPGQPDDPRLKVIFQPDKNKAYSAMPTEGSDVTAIQSQVTVADLTKTFPSLYNRTTFEQNASMPYMIFTSTESHLGLAEASLRWPALGLNARDEYKMAIQQSIDYYYNVNAANAKSSYEGFIPESRPAKPSQAEIDFFLTSKMSEWDIAGPSEKIGLIFDQRYVHYQLLNSYELWADVRRLFKELGSRVFKGPSNMPLMERFPYPSNLESLNPNFAPVKSKSNFKTPVWWTGRQG